MAGKRPNDPEELAADIRFARRDDAQQIAHVLHVSFNKFKPLYTVHAFEATVVSPETVLKRLEEGPIWVGQVGEQIVATSSALVTTKGLYLRGMAVAPEARGRQLGWQLLECSEQFARQEGLARLYLSTTPFLAQAIRLYERFGFQRIDEGPFHLFGTPLFTMARDVRNA